MKNISLAQLKAGHKVKISEISGGRGLENRLMNMGLYKNKEVTKVSHVGLRGPVVIKVGRAILALGHGIATKIMVEV